MSKIYGHQCSLPPLSKFEIFEFSERLDVQQVQNIDDSSLVILSYQLLALATSRLMSDNIECDVLVKANAASPHTDLHSNTYLNGLGSRASDANG